MMLYVCHSVLSELIHMLSHDPTLSRMPWIILMAVATNSSVIHGLLDESTSTELWCRKFNLQPSQSCLSTIVEELIVDQQCPVHLDSRTVKFMEHVCHRSCTPFILATFRSDTAHLCLSLLISIL
jgi:hypothetical protein